MYKRWSLKSFFLSRKKGGREPTSRCITNSGDRALVYSFLAAKQARAQFALDVSSQQYLISKRNAGNASSRLRFQIAKGNGEALMQFGRYDESKVELDQAYEELSPTDYDTATSMGLQSELELKLGFIEKSIDYSSGALSKLGIQVPKTQFGLWYSLAIETLIQHFHSCFPRLIRLPARCIWRSYSAGPRTRWLHFG